MALTIKWSSTVCIGKTKVVFGTSAGSVSGVGTDNPDFGPGTATGSFAAGAASVSLTTDPPAPGDACPTGPVFSAFTVTGSLSL